MNILNECLYIAPSRTNSNLFARLNIPPNLISRECFAKYFDERPISRQVHTIQIIIRVNVLRSKIKPHQSFTCAWHTGH